MNDNLIKDYKRMIKAFVEAFLRINLGARAGRWPMPIFKDGTTISFYSSAHIISAFMEATSKLLEQGLTLNEIAAKYQYPSRLARLIHLFTGRNLWEIPPERQIEVGLRLVSILSPMYKAYPLCEDSRNIIYDEKILEERYGDKLTNTKPKLDYKDVKRLNGYLWLLSESYFPRFPNTFFEFSGPYKMRHQWLSLKEFHNLKPEYLPINFAYPFKNLAIIELYDQPVDLRFDIVNRSFTPKPLPLPHSTIILSNGNIIFDTAMIKQLQEQVLKSLAQAVQYLAPMEKEQMISFNIKAELYAFLYSLLGEKCFDLADEIHQYIQNPVVKDRIEKEIEYSYTVPRDEAGLWKRFDLRVKF